MGDENVDSADKSRKLSAPVNMKNRNIVDYLKVCHSVRTVRHECLAPPTTWSDGRLTERSFWPPARADQNPADRPIPALWSEHPHGICTQVKRVDTVHRVDNSWYVLVLGLEQNVRQWSERHKTASFSSNPRFWSSDLNIRMVSASLSNMSTPSTELTIPGMFYY
jgi:hypothetical protein